MPELMICAAGNDEECLVELREKSAGAVVVRRGRDGLEVIPR
jgi:hypothetical protein